MRKRKHSTIVMVAIMTALLSLAGGLAFAEPTRGGAASPDLDLKREMVRKQQEQRLTPEKRKAAAEALKAERLRVHKAKQAAKESPPVTKENK